MARFSIGQTSSTAVRRFRRGSPAVGRRPPRAPARTARTSSGSAMQNRQPPPPAPQTLAALRAGRDAPRDQRLDRRRRHAGRQLLARRPTRGRSVRATPSQSRASSASRKPPCRRDDALEAVEDVPVAVDMALGDLPVVRAREMRARRCRRARCRAELHRVDGERDAPDAVRPQLDGGDAAVVGRTIVLHAGRHVDHLRFDVHRDSQQRLAVEIACPPSARARRRRRRSAPTIPRCRRRRAIRRACAASGSRPGRSTRAC